MNAKSPSVTWIGRAVAFTLLTISAFAGAPWSQRQEIALAPGDGAPDDRLGCRVAMSGNVAVIGDYRNDIGANADQGSVIIYRFDGSTWVEEARLTASDGQAGDEFGFSVAINGNVAVIGAVWDDVGPNVDQGSAYVFRFNGTNWVQEQKLTSSDGAAGDLFGNAVAVSGDAIAVGAPYNNLNSIAEGAVYVFRFNGSSWVQEQKLITSDPGSGDAFGTSVCIDGGTILGGANGDNNGAVLDQGAAYIFRYNGSSWSQQQKLKASDGGAGDWFGWSASLSGNVAMIGSTFDDIGLNSNQGSAYIFRFNGTVWAQEQKLTAPDGAAGDQFGWTVSTNGTIAVVGADLQDVGLNTDQGSTYIFRYNGSTWVQEQKITSSDGAANDWFGFSVDTNGDMILVGALFHDIGVNADQGAAYIFGPPLPECGISLNPAEASFTASGGSGSVTVSVAEGCDWTAAASDPSWILISNPIGEGPGTINYTVTQNLIASPRDGTITVGDQTHTIHQCGALPVGSKLRAKIKAMGIPKSMTPGQVVHVLFIVTNTGNVTWTEECGFRLGKVNGTADPFGPERIDLPPGVSVAPGQSWTFETNLTAPQVPGAYTTKWQMLQEGNAWFGKPVQKRIKVVLPQQAINALLFSPSAGNAPDAEDEE